MSAITISMTRHDFPEDWRDLKPGSKLYDNTCRECGANIKGAKHRRTCRVCVEIFQKNWDRKMDQEARDKGIDPCLGVRAMFGGIPEE